MRALQIYAGPKALDHVRRHGLQPSDIGVVPGAAGGPKGLILGPLDRFLFGEWLPQSQQPVHLVGASIGAWRMATACLPDPVSALQRFEREYIAQDYAIPAGRKRPTAAQVSAIFSQQLQRFYRGLVPQLLDQARYRLHLMTSRGRHLLRRDGPWRTPLGYLGAYLSNAVHRRALGAWIDRVVFSSPGADLPFARHDFRTHQVALTPDNFMPALQASCSIPFVLEAVPHIPGAPAGAYWDGGITDYHLHLPYDASLRLVLYPHFQRQVVPGWLDKAWKRRHQASAMLDHTVVLAPHPDWVRRLPNGKLPDRSDFTHYAHDRPGRMQVWNTAAAASQQLADEWAAWLQRPDPSLVQPL